MQFVNQLSTMQETRLFLQSTNKPHGVVGQLSHPNATQDLEMRSLGGGASSSTSMLDQLLNFNDVFFEVCGYLHSSDVVSLLQVSKSSRTALLGYIRNDQATLGNTICSGRRLAQCWACAVSLCGVSRPGPSFAEPLWFRLVKLEVTGLREIKGMQFLRD